MSLRKVAVFDSRTYTDLDDLKDTMTDKGHKSESAIAKAPKNSAGVSDFVLDKAIFSGVFEKDIRRVYVYKKAERLAKAIHLIGPAFAHAPSLRNRLDQAAVALVDSAVLSPAAARESLSRELLALSSILGIARTSGALSPMNADLITQEAHQLLGEVAGYEEPKIMFDEVPTLAMLAKAAAPLQAAVRDEARLKSLARITYDPVLNAEEGESSIKDNLSNKGHQKGQTPTSKMVSVSKTSSQGNQGRRENILAVLRSKGPSFIKDISLIVRDIGEKTIQRELAAMVAEGVIVRKGDRRWTTYELAGE